MGRHKSRRGANRGGTPPAVVKALRDEVERLKLRNAKLEAECQTPQEEEKEKEVKLPTEVWTIIAGKVNKNDVCSFALVSKQLREAQVLAGRKLVTTLECLHGFSVTYFTKGWCAYWSRKFNVRYTDPELIKRVLYVAAGQGYLQVFEKYWSQGPKGKLSQLWDERTCGWAAFRGQLEVLKWLRAKGCPWGILTSTLAAQYGHLEVLQWMRAQDPPCPWNSLVCYYAVHNGHLEVLRWARRQGCPWGEGLTSIAARNGHLKILIWLIKEGYPYDKGMCRQAAVEGGVWGRKVLAWLDE
ncbi:hypothetical protein HKI87_08g55560 [Chloropicon roscoffensis]|uniref:Uncharacterized protein n=1 Tax=Chloropicon roscoffensis TaxID=1461544 RepID=A0AAX4PCP9_9CHLO